MNVIPADYDRRLVIPGVPGLAKRPVDIDTAQTGFANLRTLRIYHFESAVEVDGHAEEDEVFVAVLSGSIKLAIGTESAEEVEGPFTLLAPKDACGQMSAAYLPPHASYRLTALVDAEVAYARAIPRELRGAKFLHTRACSGGAEVDVLLDEGAHGSVLRLRLMEMGAKSRSVQLLNETDAPCEAMAHFHCSPATLAVTAEGGDDGPLPLSDGDTLVIRPGERPWLEVMEGASVSVMMVLAVSV